MSNPGGREMVFCHRCEDEWYRDQHGLQCPHCGSEFVEVIEADNNPQDFLHGAHDEDDEQWAPTGGSRPEFGNFGTFGRPPGFPFSDFPPQQADRGGPGFNYTEHRTPGGGMVFTSFSYSSNGNRGNPTDAQAQIMNSFGGMMQGLLGNLANGRGGPNATSPFFPQTRSPQSPYAGGSPRSPGSPQPPQQVVDPLPGIMSQFFPPQAGSRSAGSPGMNGMPGDEMPPNPLLGMMRMILSGHPMLNMGGHGDAAYSQEEFDRIMSQLLEQAQQGGGAPPASQTDIASIPKKRVTQEWLDAQDSKECTICMEEAELGTEISELWCQHWFHQDCIKMWLDTHDQCPLCRKPLQQGREEFEAKNAKSRRDRRHSSRSQSHRDWKGSRDDGSGASGGSASGGADNGNGGGIRDRISSLFRGTGR